MKRMLPHPPSTSKVHLWRHLHHSLPPQTPYGRSPLPSLLPGLVFELPPEQPLRPSFLCQLSIIRLAALQQQLLHPPSLLGLPLVRPRFVKAADHHIEVASQDIEVRSQAEPLRVPTVMPMHR